MTLDGNRVRKFLREKNRTKEWLAVQLGCSLSSVDHMLGGRVPKGEKLLALAKVMGCRAEDLATSGPSLERAAI